MKNLGKLSRLALALLAGGPALARAQVPVVPGAPATAVPAAAVPPPGVAAVPAAPVAAQPRNLWSFLCPNAAQTAKIRACFCGSQFGQLINNTMSPVSVFTGGVLPQPCPILDPADLALPPDSAQGAAAQVKKDTLEAAKRRAAIRYISTADCNWWPEVQAALANSLRMDRNVCVRMEAALALQRGCCCNPTTVRALVQALSPLPTDGNPPEDSPRVRAAAMVALEHCLCCYYAITAAPPPPPAAPAPAPEQLPQPRKEGPPPEETPPPPPPPPPGAKPVVRAEPPLRPVSASGPARDASMDQLVQEARRILQREKQRQEAANRAAAAKPQSLTELLEETFSPSTTRAALDAGKQKTTPPPTIFGPPVRTTVVVQPSPAPSVHVATAPKGNSPLAPVAANAVPSLTPPGPAAPTAPPAAPPSAATMPPVSTTPPSQQTLKTAQLLLLLCNSSHADVRAYAARSLGGSAEPTPALVQALVKSAGTDASSDVRLACLKTLLKLRVNDPTLPSTLMRLQTDQDARVRDAAKTLHEQLQSRADASPTPRS